MKRLTTVLIVACTLIATNLFFIGTAKADITISKTVDVSSKTDTAAANYANLFKQAAKMGPLGKAMSDSLDLSFKGVVVVQLDNCNAIGAKGPTTQFLVYAKFKNGTTKWVLSKLNPLQAVKDAYATTGAKAGVLVWTQGDDEAVEIPASEVQRK